MLQIATDFREEVDELHAFLQTLKPDDWKRETAFMGWSIWDVVAHLHYFDVVSLASLESEETFAPERQAVIVAAGQGRTLQDLALERFASLDAKSLLAQWLSTAHILADAVGQLDPKQRVPWFGPDMGVRMFTTARYMETWAHAQEVYDLVGAARVYTDKIKNIATIGVKTFGWTFANRKLEIPDPPPCVRLVAPSGEIWEWNEPSETESVRGSAVDFCHVVTQGRNVADTKLEVTGPTATQWMSIAQCFAGTVSDPPAPGTRLPAPLAGAEPRA